jgi:stress response protein SCP2
VGLGWTTSASDLDLDASCLVLQDKDNDGDLDPINAVYFGNKIIPGIQSMGDNRSGEGAGDDELIEVDLNLVDKNFAALAFCVNIYSSGRSFKEVTNSYVRLFDPATKHEYARLSLDANCKANGVIFCVIYRGKANEPWSLLSVGEDCGGNTCMSVVCGLWDGNLRETFSSAPAAAPAGCCVLS